MCLWVDAICINQGHDEEKGLQVDHMPKIYSRARGTYLVLGEGDDEAQALVELSERREVLPKSLMEKIFALRYFSRIGILQEVALSTHIRPILGAAEVDWWSTSSQSPPSYPAPVPALLYVHFGDQFGGSAGSLHALQLGRLLQATKAENKVFAVLRMVDPNRDKAYMPITILASKKVYVRVAKHLIKFDGGSLRSVLGSIVCNRSMSLSTEPEYDLPSWVPD